MQAYVCPGFGPLEQTALGELARPEPGPGELTLRVRAAGVNFYDTLIVQGKYQIRPVAPFAPGGEVAGEVLAVGEGVCHVQPGQRVAAFISYGGYAQVARAKASQTWPLPDGVGFEDAAASLVTYGTSWFGLHDRARLKAGETVLVLGAAGGVGLAAIQIAHAAGTRVLAAAGSPQRLELCRQSGAEVLIDYSREDLKDAVKAATAGRGADVVVDVVGGAYTEAAVRATAWRGRVLIIGFAAGEIPRVPANLLLLKGCDVGGVFWDEFLRREPEAAREQMAAMMAGLADGSLRPVITGRYPLARAGEALQALAERQAAGKLIVLP